MHRWLLLTLAAIPLVFNARTPSSPSIIWWTTNGLEKIRPYDKPPEKLTKSVRLSAARNEFEPFQIVFRSELQDVDEDIDVDGSDLHGPGGAMLSKNNIAVYFERYLDLPKPSSIEGVAGEWPDPLIPRVDRYFGEKRNAFPFKLSSKHNQPVWIEVYVPPSTPPGKYQGTVTVWIGGKRDATIPVTLDVWNFSLPSTSSLPNTYGFSGGSALRQHAGAYTNDRDVRRFTSLYRKAALWHRLSLHAGAMIPPRVRVSGSKIDVDWTDYDMEVGPFLDGKVFGPTEPLYGAKATTIDLRMSRSLETDQQKILYLRAFASHFREKGWFDRLFNYLIDEPKPDDFEKMLRNGRLVHIADPELKNLVTAPLHTDWSGVIDIWTPLVNCFVSKPGFLPFCGTTVQRDEYVGELAKGKRVWWYQSCASHGCNTVGGEYFRGWPSYVIDNTGVANRIMPWLSWKYDIQGELYYNIAEAYAMSQDPWATVFLFGGNGDGTLVYPGRPAIIGGKTDIPIESIRLKLIREGLEDYEYLVLLSKSAGTSETERLVNSLVTNAYTFERDPAKFYEVRRRIGEKLNVTGN